MGIVKYELKLEMLYDQCTKESRETLRFLRSFPSHPARLNRKLAIENNCKSVIFYWKIFNPIFFETLS